MVNHRLMHAGSAPMTASVIEKPYVAIRVAHRICGDAKPQLNWAYTIT